MYTRAINYLNYKMKKFLILLLPLFIFGCKKKSEINLEDLSGYWQIEKVALSDSTEKEFGLSTTIDFIEINGDTSGIRKKVAPKLDGTFTTSKSAETFSIKKENDSLHLYYKTPYNSWKETILHVKDSSLVVLNKDKIKYTYKRFKNFTFE
jgi:hypothetical protein